jgi:hypothetical protein
MRLIKNKRRRDPRYFLYEGANYASKAVAFGLPADVAYGTLLMTVSGKYADMLNSTDLPSGWPDAIRGTIIPTIDDEELRSDNMSDDEIATSAERMVPAGPGQLTQMMNTPLAEEALGSGDQAGGGFAPDYDDDDL